MARREAALEAFDRELQETRAEVLGPGAAGSSSAVANGSGDSRPVDEDEEAEEAEGLNFLKGGAIVYQ